MIVLRNNFCLSWLPKYQTSLAPHTLLLTPSSHLGAFSTPHWIAWHYWTSLPSLSSKQNKNLEMLDKAVLTAWRTEMAQNWVHLRLLTQFCTTLLCLEQIETYPIKGLIAKTLAIPGMYKYEVVVWVDSWNLKFIGKEVSGLCGKLHKKKPLRAVAADQKNGVNLINRQLRLRRYIESKGAINRTFIWALIGHVIQQEAMKWFYGSR